MELVSGGKYAKPQHVTHDSKITRRVFIRREFHPSRLASQCHCLNWFNSRITSLCLFKLEVFLLKVRKKISFTKKTARGHFSGQYFLFIRSNQLHHVHSPSIHNSFACNRTEMALSQFGLQQGPMRIDRNLLLWRLSA